MAKQYVFPHYAIQEDRIKEIKGISRLFAYPKAPHFENEGEKVILDSGAYGLFQQGGKMNLNYMKKLSEHYYKYSNDKTICIAPDEFLSPMQSMMNIKRWYNNNLFPDIAAVLQCNSKNNINEKDLKFQVDFYSNFTDEICFSNNNLTGEQAKILGLESLFKYMKKEKNVKWIHVLGAGWSTKDVKDWLDIKYFDSLDSIAYYTSPEAFEAKSVIGSIENIIEVI